MTHTQLASELSEECFNTNAGASLQVPQFCRWIYRRRFAGKYTSRFRVLLTLGTHEPGRNGGMELPVIYNHHQRSVCNSDLSHLSLGFFLTMMSQCWFTTFQNILSCWHCLPSEFCCEKMWKVYYHGTKHSMQDLQTGLGLAWYGSVDSQERQQSRFTTAAGKKALHQKDLSWGAGAEPDSIPPWLDSENEMPLYKQINSWCRGSI